MAATERELRLKSHPLPFFCMLCILVPSSESALRKRLSQAVIEKDNNVRQGFQSMNQALKQLAETSSGYDDIVLS
jgi:hypothetical protein